MQIKVKTECYLILREKEVVQRKQADSAKKQLKIVSKIHLQQTEPMLSFLPVSPQDSSSGEISPHRTYPRGLSGSSGARLATISSEGRTVYPDL